MSQEVDQRVVEMRFDNAQFEKNVKQSMDSLKALDESLRFDGAEKGFEKIQSASKQVDFEDMTGAVEALTNKFSALEVMGTTALVKLTSQAIDTGEKLVKSLSIDQVTAGWNKYAQKTASVQTIMNATGKSINKVNSYLDKLMWFSDETSYGFTDMTAALSTLTSAGGDIEKMIPMIMGMANATAYAGKGAAEFQRVIYNLAQSYGTGAIQLIDWKSVEQAGVASQQLKQLLIDTGVELGKIKKGAVTTGTFDNSLQKKWADKEVMEVAFGKYAEFAEAVKKQVDEKSLTDPYYTTADAIEDLEDQYDEVTVKAFKAAQEAKSFSEAVEATKDAVSSGWMETFDILFGNYDEAKAFWSDLTEQFWDIFAGGAKGRNNWLKSAFDSGLDQMMSGLGLSDTAYEYESLLQQIALANGAVTAEDIEEAGSFQKAMENGSVDASMLAAAITGVNDQLEQYQGLSDEALKKLTINGKNIDPEKYKKTWEVYHKLNEELQNGTLLLDDYADKMGQLSGREHFYNGILNILEGINSVLAPIREAFEEVFFSSGEGLFGALKGFDEFTAKLQLSEASAEKLKKVFKGAFSAINIGLKGVTTVGRIALTVLEKLLDLLSPVTDLLGSIAAAIGDVLTYLDVGLGQAESLSDVIEILTNALAYLLAPLYELWQGFKTFVRGGNMDEAKSQFGAFGAVINAVTGVLDKFRIGGVSATSIVGAAVQVLGGILLGAFSGIEGLISGAIAAFTGAKDKVQEGGEENLGLLENIREAIGSLPEKASDAMTDFGSVMTGVLNSISNACKTGLDALRDFFNLDNIDIYRLLALIDVGALALAIWGISKAMNSLSASVKKVLANPVTDLLNSVKNAVDAWTKQHTTNNMAAIAKGIGIFVASISASIYLLSRIENPVQMFQALGSVLASLFALIIGLRVLAGSDITGLDTAKLVGSMTAIAGAMLALSVSIKMIGTAAQALGAMDKDKMIDGLDGVGKIMLALMGVLAVLGAANATVCKSGVGYAKFVIQGASSLIAAAAALDLIAAALIPLSFVPADGLEAASEAIMAVSLAMSILVLAIAGADKLKGNAGVKGLENALAFAVKLGSIVIALNGISSALLMTAGAVAIFANTSKIVQGMVNMGLALGGLTVAALALSKFGEHGKRMLKGAAAMSIMSAALTILAGAVWAMTTAMSADETGAGMAGLALGLIVLAGACVVLGKVGPETTAAAVSIALLGAALIEFALAMQMLNGMSGGSAIGIAVGLGAALAGLVTAVTLFPAAADGMETIGKACLMLAAALLILTPAFRGLASLKWDEALAGVIGLAGIVGSVLAMSAALGFIPPLATGLIMLATVMGTFSTSAIKMAAALAIFALLGTLAEPIAETLSTAAPDIEDALTSIISIICDTIVNNEDRIREAIVSLARIVLQSIVDVIGWAWDGNGEGGGIKSALDGLLDNVLGWFDEKRGQLNWWELLFGSRRDAKLEDVNPFGNPDAPLNKFFGWLTGGNKKEDTTQNDFAEKAAELQTQADALSAKADEVTEKAKGQITQIGVVTGQTAQVASDTADAMVKVVTADGQVQYMTAETARALMGTSDATTGLAGAESETAASAGNLAAAAYNSTGVMTIAKTEMETQAGQLQDDAKEQAGKVADKVKEGLTDNDSVTTVKNGILQFGDTLLGGFGTLFNKVLEIANTAGQNTAKSFANGLNGKSGPSGVVTVEEFLGGDGKSVKLGGKDVPLVDTNTNTPENKNSLAGLYEQGKNWWETTKEKGKEEINDLIGDMITTDPDTTSPTGNGTTTKKGSTKKQKTVAEQIEEAYKTKLAANKTLKDTTDETYELWVEQNQNTVSGEELVAKKLEHSANAISVQADRVDIAKAKYEELTSKWGKDKQETKDAYLDWIEEQKTLAELRNEQYEDIYKEISSRYDTEESGIEKQHSLWTAQNERTATKLEKLEREEQEQKDELAVKEKKEALAKQEYEKLQTELGDANQLTIAAYQDWLDAQTETQQLMNDIADTQLDKIEAELDLIQTAQSRMQTKSSQLEKVYGDGDLSGREDAYKAAVEKYGKDSKQARQAQVQGTTSAILSTVTALKNMNYQMKQTVELQKKYAEATEENKDAVQDELDASRTAFLGFAENLADALNLEDADKGLVMKLADVVEKHWDVLSKTYSDAWTQVLQTLETKLPGITEKLNTALGAAWSDEGMEVGTEFVSAIVSAISGDWGGAAVSALSAALDFAGTDLGKNLMKQGTEFVTKQLLPLLEKGLGQAAGAVDTAINGSGGLIAILQTAGVDVAALTAGSGGLAGAFAGMTGTIGAAFESLVAMLPEIWPFILIGGTILAILAAIGAIIYKNRADKKDETSEIDKELDRIDAILQDDYEYHPVISPVVDKSGLDGWDDVFGTGGMLSLAGGRSQRLASQMDTQNAKIQNGSSADTGSPDVVAAIETLGGRMDEVSDSIRGLKWVVNGKALAAELLPDIDAGMGERTARSRRGR